MSSVTLLPELLDCYSVKNVHGLLPHVELPLSLCSSEHSATVVADGNWLAEIHPAELSTGHVILVTQATLYTGPLNRERG